VANPLFVVRDGEEAICYLKGEGVYEDRQKYPLPGVLFLDLKLPRKDGLEILRWLQTQPQFDDLLIVVLTGFGGVTEMNASYQSGADSFLVKPFRKEDLKNLIEYFPMYWTRFN
jgi:CheY-like chemotaxis protein